MGTDLKDAARSGGAGEARGLACVLTTIQEPTGCVRGLARALSPLGGELLVIGDRKGPARFDLPELEGSQGSQGSQGTQGGAKLRFYPMAEQASLPFALAPLLPTGHYARKNVGYLLAMASGAGRIYETDDDNEPMAGWGPRELQTEARAVSAPAASASSATATARWLNVYRLFTNELIWPRGLPLDRVTDPATFGASAGAGAGGTSASDAATKPARVTAPIQQGLADGAPDVDAVWRLILDREFRFKPGPSILLPAGTWCPFNSQNTWWWPDAFPLMYLPAFCSFRMTDIWRSFVAQRCLWEMGHGLVFHAADVLQLRNVHNLMRDFKDEVSGYENNDRIASRLDAVTLRPGAAAAGENLVRCYEALSADAIFPPGEMDLVRAWVTDCEKAGAARGA